MKTKKILGLDLGTNSIGWALIEENEKSGKILGLGSRIVPMDGAMLQDFEKGKPTTKNVTRRQARSARRLLQRYKLRRHRLLKVFEILGWMPKFETIAEMHTYLNSSPTNKGRIISQFELYELRDRALREILTTEEIARILYHFNQRRGFLSNRKVKDTDEEANVEESESSDKELGTIKTYKEVEIISIATNNEGKKTIYSITLADGTVGAAYQPIPFVPGKKIELLITEKNTKKFGKSFFFQLPKKMDWSYRKHHVNSLIQESGLTLGQFYFQELKKNPHFRTKDNIILREKYIQEFEAIWNTQMSFRKDTSAENELIQAPLLKSISESLYLNNKERQIVLQKKGLKYILKDDILYYQRPLKSQKDSISKCRFEPEKRVIPASHPLYQEFRIIDTINNLRVYNWKDEDCTKLFLNEKTYSEILSKLNSQKEVKPSVLKNILIPKSEFSSYYLSHNDDKRGLKGNITKIEIETALENEQNKDLILSDPSNLEFIWHVLYSLDKTKDVVKALTRPKNGIEISESGAKKLADISYTTTYGSLSARAIKKLLPLMRSGKQWNENEIKKYPEITERIEKILSGEVDDSIANRIRDFVASNGISDISGFQGLPYWAAAYLVYGSHSFSQNNKQYSHPNEIELLPQNSLRNPIAQQIVNETLHVVKDIWTKYGDISEIRIELARELKNSAKERESISTAQLKNRDLNNAIKRKLEEMGRPIGDSDKYRLWLESLDEGAIQNESDLENYIKYLKPDGKYKASAADVTKYKLWEEQLHISPYSGRPIPLSQLFGENYQIDHIIPRQRFYDDSISNKVVVEAHINKDKGTPGRNFTAWEYISNGAHDAKIEILPEDSYVDLINRIFRGAKRKKLLLKEIPADFVLRQLKDTQYITKAIREELAKIVRLDNVHTTTGGVTDHLREQWGIAHLFKEMLLPRFEALEQKMQNEKGESIQLIQRVFDKNLNKDLLKLEGYSKRLDHRHHAADALVIACTKPAHIKKLNDLNKIYQSSKTDSKEAIQANMNVKKRGGSWSFEKPWETFLQDAKFELENCVVAIKNRNRLLTKGVNKYFARDPKTGQKIKLQQTKGTLLSARGSLHNPQSFGETRIQEKQPLTMVVKFFADSFKSQKDENRIKDSFKHQWQYRAIKKLFEDNGNDLKKVNATLKKQNSLSTHKEFSEITLYVSRYVKRTSLSSITGPKIENIANDVLKAEVKAHVESYGKGDIKKAFSGDGLAAFNQSRKIPITAVKVIDGANQTIGESIGKEKLVRKNSLNDKMHIDPASNYAFAIYENEDDIKNNVWPVRREYDIVSFYNALQLTLSGEPLFQNKIGYRCFSLSANDLVYVPFEDEKPSQIDWNNIHKIKDRLLNMTKASGSRIYFTPNHIADFIVTGVELGSQNCLEMLDNKGIKHTCIKVKVDRLGNITPVNSYD